MADGRTHGAITKGAALPLAMVTGFAYGLDAGVLSGLGCLTGLILDPDLDVDSLTRSEWRLLRHAWLWPLGFLWFGIWLPYAKLMPHRSPWSHWPVLGTAVRLLYLGAWALLLASLLGVGVQFVAWVQSWPGEWGRPFLLGLMVSDTLHWVADSVALRPFWRKQHEPDKDV